MNYTELKAQVQQTLENTFTDAQLDTFTRQTEEKIYQIVDLPAMRANQTGTVTSGNPYLTQPSGLLNVYSLAVISGSSYEYLLPKDVSFIRECFPSPAADGKPRYYSFFDTDTFILGPTPNAAYSVEIHYAKAPVSIVDAGTTWLGDNFESALFNGVVVEAARFMKAEKDDMALYESMYAQSLAILKQLGDVKMQTDEYRTGAPRSMRG